jgi:hypothetical protein
MSHTGERRYGEGGREAIWKRREGAQRKTREGKRKNEEGRR